MILFEIYFVYWLVGFCCLGKWLVFCLDRIEDFGDDGEEVYFMVVIWKKLVSRIIELE